MMPELDVILGFLAAILFRYKNQYNVLKNLITGLILGIFVSRVILEIDFEIGLYLYFVIAIVLFVSYSIRFIKKTNKQLIDYIKVVGILLLILFPISYYITFENIGNHILYILKSVMFPFLLIIFIYDKVILKTEKMKRKILSILIVQTVIILVLLIFSAYQKAEADKQRSLAIESENNAKELYLKLLKLKAERDKQELPSEN